MKATIEFDLDDEFDRRAHILALGASNAYASLFEFDNFLREEIKYKDKEYQELRDHFHDILKDHEVDLSNYV